VELASITEAVKAWRCETSANGATDVSGSKP